MILDRLQDLVREAVHDGFGVTPAAVAVDVPAERAFGDFTINAFLLAKELRRPPDAIAEALASRLQGRAPVLSAEAVKGYVNLRVEVRDLFATALPELLADPGAWGRSRALEGRRLMVEYSAPNTNKPQHLGHMRNDFLGHALAACLANAGASVIRANLYNDRGIHICKSMLAYRRWGEGRTPAGAGRKADHFVGDFYVLFEKRFQEDVDAFIAGHPEDFATWSAVHGADRKGRPLPEGELRKAYRDAFREERFAAIPLGAECTAMLRAWEAGDAGVHELWRLMNGWAFKGFEETYRALGVTFDKVYKESETWRLGRDLILEGLDRGVFQRRADGAVEIDLTADKLDRKVVLRSDGTSVYITQDIGTTVMKAREHALDGQVWVVGDEQRHHFQVLFRILARMGYSWAGGLHHLAYGMVNLPEGKMKSREGRVEDADALLEEVAGLAAAEVRARDPEHQIPDAEVARRSRVVALSALRFMLLKVTPANTMLFDPRESVKFEGDTGARVLYAYARLASMIRDAGPEAEGAEADWTLLGHEAERHLALDLVIFPDAAARAARDYNPSLVANFLLDLVRDLNRFYDRCDVLREKDPALRRSRLLLCRATALVLERAAGLLGMPLLERM